MARLVYRSQGAKAVAPRVIFCELSRGPTKPAPKPLKLCPSSDEKWLRIMPFSATLAVMLATF